MSEKMHHYSPEDVADSFEEQEEQSIINEKDREVLQTGLEKLAKKIDETPEEELPETVIFLDTSARPLVYAVKPVLDAIYRKKRVVPPQYRFLMTHANTPEMIGMYGILHGRDWEQWKTEEREIREDAVRAKIAALEEQEREIIATHQLNKTTPRILSVPNRDAHTQKTNPIVKRTDIDSLTDEGKDKLKQLQSQKHALQKEMKKIPNDIQKQLDDWLDVCRHLNTILREGKSVQARRLLVVDDYVNNGTSFQTVVSALGSIDPNAEEQASFFTFFEGIPDSKRAETEEQDQSEEASQAFWPKNYLAGVQAQKGGVWETYTGFEYRSIPSSIFSPEKIEYYKQQNEAHIGVRKETSGALVKRSPMIVPEYAQMLRNEMKKQGEQIAKTYMEKTKKRQ